MLCAGVFLFFIVFSFGMLLLLFIIGPVRLYYAHFVPKIVLVGQAHAVPLRTIFARVAARKCGSQVKPNAVPDLSTPR